MRRNLCFACCGLILGIAATEMNFVKGVSVSAQNVSEVAQKCDYTYIHDSSKPNIGSDGEIKYNKSWKTVIEDGWTLKVVGGNGGDVYIFEKCR